MNDELQVTSDDARTGEERSSAATHLLEAVLGSTPLGVLTVDLDARVTTWNQACTELWGLRAEEVVGRLLVDLDSGLPAAELAPLLEDVRGRPDDGHRSTELTAVNRRGREVRLHVTVSPLAREHHRAGALVVLDDRGARG